LIMSPYGLFQYLGLGLFFIARGRGYPLSCPLPDLSANLPRSPHITTTQHPLPQTKKNTTR